MHNDNAFTALNTALFTGGAFVHIPQDVKVDVPIHLMFLADNSQEGPVAAFPRVLVALERGAEATVIESYQPSAAAAEALTGRIR
ncbi:MAG: hypothetical protein WKF84_28605 [Pyrinomonadaceae bacterium]